MQWAKMISQDVIKPKFVWESQIEEEKNAYSNNFRRERGGEEGKRGERKQAGEIISDREKKEKKANALILGMVGEILYKI